MPNTVTTFPLTDAIKALPSGAVVEVALWNASASTLPGLVQGSWGPWIALMRPYTVSINAATTRYTLPVGGGDEYIKACSVYCTGGLPVELVPSRTARVRVGKLVNKVPVFPADDLYRVMEIRTWPNISDHAELHCKRDLGEAAIQA